MSDLASEIDDIVSTREVLPREAAPTPALKSVGDRLRQMTGPRPQRPAPATAKKAPAARKATAPAAKAAPGVRGKPGPKPAPVRRPLGETISRLVLHIGRFVNTTVDPPTGAVLMFEAGALGEAIDGIIAGSPVDRFAQKGAAISAKFEPLVPLISLPAMIFMLSRNPAMEPMLETELREAMEDVLVQSLPLLRKRAERVKKTAEALDELRQGGSTLPNLEDIDLKGAEDPIGEILHSFFAPPPNYTQPQADEESGVAP